MRVGERAGPVLPGRGKGGASFFTPLWIRVPLFEAKTRGGDYQGKFAQPHDGLPTL